MEMESKISVLEEQTKNMSEDITDIKTSLRDIADAMRSLAVLEQKHNDSYDAIVRAHKRIDDVEPRVRKLEVTTAQQLWMERVVWVSAAFAINYVLSQLVA
jgi:septal ring factor EnvC (AmiA/AmiB activator)